MSSKVIPGSKQALARTRVRRFVLTALAAAGAWLVSQAPAGAAVDRWTPVGPAGGFFTVAAAPGAPGTVYALSGDGGFSRSADGGRTWGFAGSVQGKVLAVDPSDSATIYAAGGAGVWKTTDGGSTWQVGPTGPFAGQVVVAPSAPQTLYALAAPGWERSDDGGVSWRQLGAPSGVQLLAVDPTDANAVYGLKTDGIVKSSDGGAHWSLLSFLFPGQPLRLIVDPRRPSTLYAGDLAVEGGASVWRSTDAGATWNAADAGLPRPLRDLVLAPSGTLYAAIDAPIGGPPTALWQSADGGDSWQMVSEFGDLVVGLAVDAGSPDRLYASLTPGGLLLGEQLGRSWTSPAHAPSGQWVSQVLTGPAGAGALYVTAAPASFEPPLGSFLRSSDGGGSWIALAPTAYSAFFQPRLVLDTQPGIVYATGLGSANDLVSLDDGADWQPLASPDSVSEFVDLAADPLRSGKLVKLTAFQTSCGPRPGLLPCAKYLLYRSNTGGRHWRRVSSMYVIPLPLGPFPGKIRLDPRHPENIYVVAGKLYKSTAATPALTALPLPGPVVDLAIHPLAPANLYAAVGRRRPLWKSADGGASWRSASAGLPAGAVIAALAIDPTTPATLYIATDQGVFVSDDAAATWQPFGAGLGGLPVGALAVARTLPRTVYAGTLGAGVFALTRP
jgi:photosystem II stability/assembly factor-like uncharacterized protein